MARFYDGQFTSPDTNKDFSYISANESSPTINIDIPRLLDSGLSIAVLLFILAKVALPLFLRESQRVDTLLSKSNAVDDKLDEIEEKLDRIERRIETIADKVNKISG